MPAQNLGINALANISAETLAALEAGKERESDEITTSLGESWEQFLRLKGALNDVTVPDDAEVVWNSTEARSYAQVVDGISKLTAANPALLPSLLEDIPGWNQQRIDTARDAIRRGQGAGVLDRMRQAAAGGNDQPAV